MRTQKSMEALTLAGLAGFLIMSCGLPAVFPFNSPESQVYQAVDAAWAKYFQYKGPRHEVGTDTKGTTVLDSAITDVVPPNYHTASIVNGIAVEEQYVIDGTLYKKDQDGWTRQPAILDYLNNSKPEAGNTGIVRTSGKSTGAETISGLPAIVYSYNDTSRAQNDTILVTDWVDQVSGLPLKQRLVHADGMVSERTITYDQGLVITLPDEAKNARSAP